MYVSLAHVFVEIAGKFCQARGSSAFVIIIASSTSYLPLSIIASSTSYLPLTCNKVKGTNELGVKFLISSGSKFRLRVMTI